jgi:hypothetical protein
VTVKHHQGLSSAAKIVNLDSGMLPQEPRPKIRSKMSPKNQFYCQPLVEQTNITDGFKVLPQQIYENPGNRQRVMKTQTTPRRPPKIRIRSNAVNVREHRDFKILGMKAMPDAPIITPMAKDRKL